MFLFGILSSPAQDLKEFEKRITEFTLPNGLHFILLERHEAPVISFHTYVNVGSADDPSGQTGLARMLERVAYKGTESIGTTSWPAEKKALETVEEAYDKVESEVGKGIKADRSRVDLLTSQARLAAEATQRLSQPREYLRILDENGATTPKALASFDSTTFSYSLPSHRMELWFLMESQRLIHPAFRDFYRERDAVAEETRQVLESSPQSKLLGEFLAAAFKAHPYRNPEAGWPGDIRNLRRNAAREFFDRYYVPGNITIAIAGDVNPGEARRMAEHYFGPMASRPMPAANHTEEPPQDGPKTVVVESSGPPYLAVGYKRPSQYDKDDLAFDAILSLLTQGNSGLLQRDLVTEKHLAVQTRAMATYPGGRYPNLMIFVVLPSQGHTIDDVQRGLDDFLGRFRNLSVDEQSLGRVRAQIRSTFLRRIEDNDTMAAMLALHHAQYGDWRKMFTGLDDLDKLTPDAIQRAASQYLVATGRTTAYYVAPGQSSLPPPAPRSQPSERKTGGVQ
jgi:predicted Zn-dependent peptidase